MQFRIYLNYNGNCVDIQKEDCSLVSIINDFPDKYLICREFCSLYKNIYTQITYTKNEKSEILDLDYFLSDYYYRYSNYIRQYNKLYYYNGKILENIDDNLKPIFANNKNKLCVTLRDNGDYENCYRVQYDDNTKNYKCARCYSDYDYILDQKANKCIYKWDSPNYYDDYNCLLENIGTKENPIYSCTKCYNNDYLLVTANNDIKYCIYKPNEDNSIEHCTEANADTTYKDAVYNCTNCSLNFIPYYSKFFERQVCQGIFDEIITEKDIPLEAFEGIESIDASKQGTCEKNYFTPDGKKCYKCNNPQVGIPGCKGACNFSLKRNNILKCEDGCEEGYVETSEGICESCSSRTSGCLECHYEYDYPSDFLGLKRKKEKFVCDTCDIGYTKMYDYCVKCDDLGLGRCEECLVEHNNNSYYDWFEYKCTKCNKNSVLTDGICLGCEDIDHFGIGSQCTKCDDYYNGGIENCNYCETNDYDDVICQLCNDGYILLANNNTCLKISKNKELEKFDKCEKLIMDKKKKLHCSRCKKEYTLLKDKHDEYGECSDLIVGYNYKDKFYYYNTSLFYPCQESINVGNNPHEIISCRKCYQIFEYKKSYQNNNELTNLTNYLLKNQKDDKKEKKYVHVCTNLINNCTQLHNKTKNGVEKYDCLSCAGDNERVYDPDEDINYCQNKNIPKKCMVKSCKKCQENNNYFCSQCELSNYEVNSITGQCVEKTEEVTSITWKDVYRLEMNGETDRNGQIYNGPSLVLRGITSSQINTKHAFLIYLTFKIKTSHLRTLDGEEEGEIKIPAICEAMNSVNESSNNVSIIDYECVSNYTDKNNDLNNFELNSIEPADNDGLLKKGGGNLNKILEQKTLEDLQKEEPTFTIEELMKYATFEMDEIKNQLAKNYIFDFKIEGKLNKEIAKGNINTELELNEIEDKLNCNFAIEDNQKANLNCRLDISDYKNQKIFSFKTSEINDENNNIYIAKLDEVLLINDVKEETDKKNYLWLIIGCVIGGAILFGIGIGLTIYLIKRKKKNTEVLATTTMNNRHRHRISNASNEEQSKRKIIAFASTNKDNNN